MGKKYHCIVIEKNSLVEKKTIYSFLSEEERNEFEKKCKLEGKTTSKSIFNKERGFRK